jgi:hypothetical protein
MENLETNQQTVLVSENKFQAHPEAYLMRIFVHVREDGLYYEILKTGQAVPWGESPEGKGFDFWIIDVDRMSDFGVSRA